MATLLETPRESDALQSDLATLRAQWLALAEIIERFAPAVVVLIARKTPRMFELFGLDIPGNPLVISDLAIPMCERYLAGARVAIIDDVINVGSTMRRTAKLVEAAGAREVEMFAIAEIEREPGVDPPRGSHEAASWSRPHFAQRARLDRAGLMAFAARVPEALQGLAKPYDMDFPLSHCRLEAPYQLSFRTSRSLFLPPPFGLLGDP